MTCKHPNCDRQAVALGWCRGHWETLPPIDARGET